MKLPESPTTAQSLPDTIPPDQIIANALEKLDISLEHSEACLSETRYWLENTGLDDPTLVDLTSLAFVTIDNPDSRDLDQALLIERSSEGYRVSYALADASYYIRPGSALFKEALARGTTFYTPTMAAAMLPVALSEGLISLNPNVDRRALVFDMQVGSSGTVLRTTLVRARIRSQAKLSYEGVQVWLDSTVKPTRPFDESLSLLQELGRHLIQASAARGVVSFDRTETHIQVTGTPPQFQASVRRRYRTEQYNEQISLICNMQGAELLLFLSGISDSLMAVYRVHDAPLKKSLNELSTTLQAFANLQDDPESWRWNPEQSLAEFVENLPDTPEHKRRVQAVQRQIMQAQRASSYQPEASEHHALKTASYARFSSPMREVVGIFTHKELLEALNDTTSVGDADSVLRESVIASANHARQQQRQLDKTIEFAALYSQFSHELALAEPPIHAGSIVGLRDDRLYISLDDMAVDIKVYRADIESAVGTSFSVNRVELIPDDTQMKSWQLGQAVGIQIYSLDKEKHFRFTLIRGA